MAMVINTNIASINATRQLDASSREQSVSMERLTSGLRINRSADDAAGLAVATRMTSQIMGTDQAVRNANDGISLAQTVDGAADEMSNMMQRQRELTIQSLTGTYNDTDRAAMDAEYQALNAELDRIQTVTTFNDVNVLDGSVASVDIHVGWQDAAEDSIALSTIDGATIATNVGATSIDTAVNAAAAITVLDTELESLASQRSDVGAGQNRLEYTISNLQNVSENISAARSGIQDADFAKESANLARSQVLQQAGMSMLAQANANGQNVLSLIR